MDCRALTHIALMLEWVSAPRWFRSGAHYRRVGSLADLLRRGSGEGRVGVRGVERLGVEVEAKAVGQAGQVVEQADDVCDFQTCTVVEAEGAQRFPVSVDHAGRRGAELLGHFAQCPVA